MSDARNYPDPRQHPGIEGWIKSLDDKPDDPLIRSQFADWLDEHGYSGAAHGQRFLAKYGKYPQKWSGRANDTQYGWAIGGPGNIHVGTGTGRPHVDQNWFDTLEPQYHGLYRAMLPAKFFGEIKDNLPAEEPGRNLHMAGGGYRHALHPEKEFLKSANDMQWNDEDIRGIYE